MIYNQRRKNMKLTFKNRMNFFDENLLENIKNMDNNREIEKTLQC